MSSEKRGTGTQQVIHAHPAPPERVPENSGHPLGCRAAQYIQLISGLESG